MKSNKRKVFLYVLSILFSVLSSALGYGFMGGADISFAIKVMCGFIFISTPVLVMQLLLLTFLNGKKD